MNKWKPKGFITQCNIDDAIDYWHNGSESETVTSLHEFLNMDWSEYKQWVSNTTLADWMIEHNKEVQTFESLLKLRVDGEHTIGSYLKELLSELWREGESFSGKYGISGNSDWQYELYKPLIIEDVVKGWYDIEYGEIDGFDYKECDKIIADLINFIFENKG